MDVAQAIADYEAARVALSNASADATAKNQAFIDAQNAKSLADTTKTSATSSYNTAIDNLITALQAAKVGDTPIGPLAVKK